MIDPHVFARWMGTFSERIGRPLSPITLAAYYAALGDFTTAQFELAAQAVFADHRFNTWPAPAQFRDAVTPVDTTPSGHAAFERVYSLVLAAYGRDWADVRADIVREAGEGAARTADGMRGRLRRHDVDDVPFLRRDFLAEYELATSREAQQARLDRLLPTGQARAALAAVTRPGRSGHLEPLGALLTGETARGAA